MIKFGVAGNSNSFYEQGYNSTMQAAKWCRERGIDAFEYSFGKGFRMNEDTAIKIGQTFVDNDVQLSLHAPYYINLSNLDKEKIKRTFGYIIKSLEMAKLMQASRIVIHPGSQGTMTREEAVSLMLLNGEKLSQILNELELNKTLLCFETLGKSAQLGTVEEIIKLCEIDERFFPCIDFGHINAREQGIFEKPGEYDRIIDLLQKGLAKQKYETMHIHFSKIEYSTKGEIRHLTFEDKVYGPDFTPLARSLYKRSLKPIIINESDGTQAEDALEMKKIYNSISQKNN